MREVRGARDLTFEALALDIYATFRNMDGLELRLPPNLQNALEVSAAAHERSVEDEAKALLEAALGAGLARDEVVNGTQLEQLAVLNDTQLWRLARQQVPIEKSERMQVLTERLQAEGLSPQETDEVTRLQSYAQRMMLLRAEAAVLLKRRGHEVTGLLIQP